jgi:hypothetical protein
MTLGTVLFTLAVVGNLVAITLGIANGFYRLATGKAKLPKAASTADSPIEGPLFVDLRRPSLLTTRKQRTGPDPIAVVGGESYRLTWMGGSRYLVTRLSESRRVGTFELSEETGKAQVLPTPDDEGQGVEQLLLQVAFAASQGLLADAPVPEHPEHGEHAGHGEHALAT